MELFDVEIKEDFSIVHMHSPSMDDDGKVYIKCLNPNSDICVSVFHGQAKGVFDTIPEARDRLLECMQEPILKIGVCYKIKPVEKYVWGASITDSKSSIYVKIESNNMSAKEQYHKVLDLLGNKYPLFFHEEVEGGLKIV